MTAADGPGRGPLEGLRVVESTSFVAGPLAGMTLAQMGAEVLRLDPVQGPADAGRWPSTSGQRPARSWRVPW